MEPEGYKWLLTAKLGHKSDIDWDVFEILRSLDLLYTLDSPYTPADASIPDDFSFEEIPVKERAHLVKELLAKFNTTELSAQEGTLRFLLSFGDINRDFQEPVLEALLSGTPFDALVVADYREAFEVYGSNFDESLSDYNPVLLALVLSIAYDAIEPVDDVETINEGYPVWVFDGWIICAGSELIFYAINDVVTEALPDLLRIEVTETAESIANEGYFYSFFEQEFAALSQFQFIIRAQDLNPWLGSIIADGLEAGYRNSILIVPGASTEANGPFEASNEPLL